MIKEKSMAKSKRLWAVIVIAVLAIVLSVCGITLFASAADNNEWSDVELAESFCYGETVEIPAATLRVNSKDYEATHAVVKPDGTCVSHDVISLDTVGKYVVNYYVTAAGRTYTKTVTFNVDYPGYYAGKPSASYIGGKTTVSWGIDRYAASDEEDILGLISDLEEKAEGMYAAGTITEAQLNAKKNSYQGLKGNDTEAMIIKLHKGETFVLNEFIDISDLTMEDTFIDGYLSPDKRGTADINELTFTFTDSIDPSINLRICFAHYSTAGSSFISTGGNGQELSGQNYYGSMPFHQGDGYGTSSGVSFTAFRYQYDDILAMAPQAVDKREAKFNIYFDPVDKSVYHGNARIAKLDDSTYFEKNPWSGFKSNKVKLSITASGYVTEVATVGISHLHGFTSEKLRGLCYDTAVVKDNDGPIITVNQTVDYNAVCGGLYPIPTATAFDEFDGNTSVSVKVWYLYNLTDKVRINVKDGKFKTDRVGQYVIEYVAADKFGNTTVKPVNVLSVAADTVPAITYNVNFTLTGCKVGERNVLPAPTDVSGGTGDKTVKVAAIFGEEETELVNNEFLPEKIGAWTIKYIVTDYVGVSVEKTYQVNVTENDRPAIIERVIVPNYLVSGSTYKVPKAVARDFNTMTDSVCTVKITDDGGTKEYEVGQSFVPECTGDTGEITFEFYSGANKLETMHSEIVKVWVKKTVVIGKLEFEDDVMEIDRFFDSENVTYDIVDNALKATATAMNGNWTFITPQAHKNFSIMLGHFNVNVGGRVTLTLTDCEDSRLSASISLMRSFTSTTVTAGGVSQNLSVKMEGVNDVVITYADGAFTLNGSLVMNLGSSFEGFKSDKVYVSCTNTLLSGSSYVIGSLNGYDFTAATTDTVGPNVFIPGFLGGVYSRNSNYTFEAATCYDVLFENIKTFTLTVKDPNGATVTDVSGVPLDGADPSVNYKIKLTTFGDYKVEYYAEDESGNVSVVNYIIVVFDTNPPEIKFKGKTPTTAKVGDAIYMPDFEVKDNITAAEDIFTLKYVVNPNGKTIWLTQEKDGETISLDGIVTTMAGVYEFHVMAFDESGNIAEAIYSVTVS